MRRFYKQTVIFPWTISSFSNTNSLNFIFEYKFVEFYRVPTVVYGIWNNSNCWSQWPRSLRRRSAAARLLRSRVRIPPEAWMSVVSVVCCQVEVSATSWSLVQRSRTDCVLSVVCDQEKSREWGGHSPRNWAAAPKKKHSKWEFCTVYNNGIGTRPKSEWL